MLEGIAGIALCGIVIWAIYMSKYDKNGTGPK
jgi:hypothetical protein